MIPCKFFALNACMKGSSCRFTHSLSESSTLPQYAVPSRPNIANLIISSSSSSEPKGKAKADEECRYFVKVACYRGAKCQFRHGSATLQKTTEVPEARPSLIPEPPVDSRSLVPCRYFALSQCTAGRSCPYLHSEGAKKHEKTNFEDRASRL